MDMSCINKKYVNTLNCVNNVELINFNMPFLFSLLFF